MSEETYKYQNIQTPQLDANKEEIDLIALAKTVWEGRKSIIKIIIIFFIIGLFVAIYTPKQYEVSSVMVPQVSGGKSKLGGLSSLAAMAGFNLDMGSSGSELSPMIYPKIIQSIPFQKELMYTPFNFEGYNEKITLYDFYTMPQYRKFNLLGAVKKYTIGLPALLINSIKGKPKASKLINRKNDNIQTLTAKEKKLSLMLNGSVSLNVQAREGYLTLTATMPEALIAAQLGQKTQELLQKYIIEFKIEKAQAQLNFVEERYTEKKKAFEQAQKLLAQFRDQNKNVSTAIARTEEERLQSEYQIAQSVYNELAKQLENSRIQVREETPVFSIIEPISVPTENFKPKRKKIVFVWIFLGGLFGIGWVFGKGFYKSLKEKWKENK